MLLTLREAQDAGWVSPSVYFDEPWCVWFDTDSGTFRHVTRPSSPTSVMDR
jgi:hypothetical protein